MDRSRRLSHLEMGHSAKVLRIEGEDAVSSRLIDLGFWPGTSVQALRKAPLGDPALYRIQGYRLALRRSEASRIWVTPESETA